MSMTAIKRTPKNKRLTWICIAHLFFYTVCVQSSLYNEGKNTLVRKEEFMVKQYVSFRWRGWLFSDLSWTYSIVHVLQETETAYLSGVPGFTHGFRKGSVFLNFLVFLWVFFKYYPKRQELLTLLKHLGSLPVFWWGLYYSFFSELCLLFCLSSFRVLSWMLLVSDLSILDCPLGYL